MSRLIKQDPTDPTCRSCRKKVSEGARINPSRIKKQDYICNPCHKARQKQRDAWNDEMLIRGIEQEMFDAEHPEEVQRREDSLRATLEALSAQPLPGEVPAYMLAEDEGLPGLSPEQELAAALQKELTGVNVLEAEELDDDYPERR